jgi:carbon storage regulator
MLVLTRKVGERICIGDDVVLTVTAIDSQRVRIGIEAPRSVSIWREELCPRSETDAAESAILVGR